MTAKTQTAPVPAHELVFEPQQLPKLRSNYGSYLDQRTVGWMRETNIDTPLDEMRRRFDDDGYIFVKGLMPREDVLDMREAYFKHLQPTGILKPGSSPRDGIFDVAADPIAHNGVGGSDLPEDADRVDKLESAHSLPIYLAFLKHPKLRTFVREFMGWEKEVLIKRTLLRQVSLSIRIDCICCSLNIQGTMCPMACPPVFIMTKSSSVRVRPSS